MWGLSLSLGVPHSTSVVTTQMTLLLMAIFFLERVPLGFALCQQLGRPAIILLLRKAEAASENTFALIGFFSPKSGDVVIELRALELNPHLEKQNEDKRKV